MQGKNNKIEIYRLASGEVERLRELLTGNPSFPYRFLPLLANKAVIEYWLEDFREVVADPQGAVFVAEEDGLLVGAAGYNFLPWDSRILGRRMASLKHLLVPPKQPDVADLLTQQITAHATEHGLEFLSCRPYTSDIAAIHALERQGFLLMDTLVECVYDMKGTPLEQIPPPKNQDGIQIYIAEPEDAEQLLQVSRLAFAKHFGRFHSDDRISHELAVRIYEEWIVSCVRGWADWVLVADVGGQMAGFSAWKKPSTIESQHGLFVGHYSIGAVHPQFFGRGIFSALTYEGMHLFPGLADWIEGPTHINNIEVQRGYLRLGWRLVDARHTFHKWLGKDM